LVGEAPYEITANNKIISVGFKRGTSIFSVGSCLGFQVTEKDFKRSHSQGDGVTEYSNNINGATEIVIEGENRIIIPVKNNNARYEALLK
jgi:predicted RNase H-like HicB family nuclease